MNKRNFLVIGISCLLSVAISRTLTFCIDYRDAQRNQRILQKMKTLEEERRRLK